MGKKSRRASRRDRHDFLTAAIMVKNEVENLPTCLESIRHLVDRVVIHDTGSTDGTLDVIKAFMEDKTYPPIKFREAPWRNNFSLHRNLTIADVETPWLVIVDADEEWFLAPEHSKGSLYRNLREIDKHPKYGAAAIQQYDMSEDRKAVAVQYSTIRFFRTDDVKYEGRVHNQPKFTGSAVFINVVALQHYGANPSPEKEAAKAERTIGLLREQLKDDPDRIEPHFYLCQSLGKIGRDKEAVIHGRAYIRGRSELHHFNRTIFYTLCQQLKRMGRIEESVEIMDQGLREMPNDPDLNFAMSDHASEIKDYGLMMDSCRRYLTGIHEYQQNPTKSGNTFVFSLNSAAILLQKYRLMICELQEGMAILKQIKGMDLSLVEGLEAELKTNLRQFGLGHLIGENMHSPKIVAPHKIRGEIKIGQRAQIKASAVIDISADVTIGDDFIMSDDAKIFTHAHPMAAGRTILEQTQTDGVTASPIKIGNDVYICDGARILSQVTEIPAGTVVGAGAVLTKNPPVPGHIWAGNPARCVGKRE